MFQFERVATLSYITKSLPGLFQGKLLGMELSFKDVWSERNGLSCSQSERKLDISFKGMMLLGQKWTLSLELFSLNVQFRTIPY